MLRVVKLINLIKNSKITEESEFAVILTKKYMQQSGALKKPENSNLEQLLWRMGQAGGR